MESGPIADDYYRILNVRPSATTDEIQKSYKSLSRIFHPDRLRVQTAQDAELARETFVRVKTAHGILCDAVHRFAYDRYGAPGLQYLQLCERAKASKLPQTQNDLPLDPDLYDKLKDILEQEDLGQQPQWTLAMQIFQRHYERFRRQVQLARQRMRDSYFSFDATIELPCVHHPQAAGLVDDVSSIPYLELEEARLDFTVKATNQRPTERLLPGDKVPPLQRHICRGSLGSSSQWASNGTACTELTLGAEYQEAPSSNTRWGCEVSFPVTAVKTNAIPLIVQLNSTHLFADGTTMVAGLRGSALSRKSWQYSITSTRKLCAARLLGTSNDPSPLRANLRATCGAGIKALTGEPSTYYISLANLPSRHPSQQSGNKKNSSPWTLSDPQLSVRAGLLPNPLQATLEYQEFGRPWASLLASWSWNYSDDCSKIKLMLSADLWGSYEDNDTTTIRTGLRHDLVSGWIWMWEWEELDWTLKVPISLSPSKNSYWLLLALGRSDAPAQGIHDAVFRLLASYFVLNVARSMLTDWTGAGRIKQPRGGQHDATFSDNRDSFCLEGGRGNDAHINGFCSLMEKVSDRKRREEAAKDGLVIRSVVWTKAQRIVPSSKMDEDIDLESFPPTARETGTHHNLTKIFQFWVRHGQLKLPPLVSQTSPHYYIIGGNRPKEDSASDFHWSLTGIAKLCQTQLQKAADWLHHVYGNSCDTVGKTKVEARRLSIRYQYASNTYEVSLSEEEAILLPHASALLLGPAARIT